MNFPAGPSAYEQECGDVLRRLGRYDQAEPFLLASHAAYLASLGESSKRTRHAAELLARLYADWNRSGDAAAWAARSNA